MREIAIEVGRVVCHLASSMGGFGHARCYDPAALQAIGSGFLFAALALVGAAGTLSHRPTGSR